MTFTAPISTVLRFALRAREAAKQLRDENRADLERRMVANMEIVYFPCCDSPDSPDDCDDWHVGNRYPWQD